ncbi:PREDICTED: protein unc-13 homolog D isoform X2 [Nicrophorus vespilloides]|uniref:Protein unc-13 homolog D isoform X2 n=1 Tax=Nicrophorus vespilloides TaxID=110193 RepID=A0ABM1N909_NICVS|nr:PREDICTED: protein unc-13 homolog D isoform X2 [Nicrophorus vespilloides]
MESEDLMIRTFEKIKRMKSVDEATDHDKRLQEHDNSFFEKFGSLLAEHNENSSTLENLEKIKLAEAAAEAIKPIPEESEDDDSGVEDGQSTATATSEATSDSDTEKETEPEDYIAVVWNIDELYSEILYQTLHNVGCDESCEFGQEELFHYLQDAFKISPNKHQELLEEAKSKEAPEIHLNVEVIEAKDLRSKDSNGLSDPFVTLFLASNAQHRYTTSVKSATLNPTWEEHFALPVSENSEDTLCLEVWDFDAAESVREKFGKFFEVKGVKGIRKLVKEIAITAATGQHENELIGRAKIPLNAIPVTGMTMWYSLDKKHKINRQGVLKVRLNFSSEKNSQVAAQEHRHLLRLLLVHELEHSKVAPYWWSGTFSGKANTFLSQHIAQSGLQPIDVALSQYAVFVAIHQNHPLSFNLFSNLLEKLIKPVQSQIPCDEDLKIFWDATKKLLPSVFAVIRKLRRKCSNEKTAMKQLIEVLECVSKVSMLEPPEGTNLFPEKLYQWMNASDGWDIRNTLTQAVERGAEDWFCHILENSPRSDDSDIGKLQHLIKITQLIRTDLQRATEFYDKIFKNIVNFPYAKSLYMIYQVKIATMAEPEVLHICKSLKRLSFHGFEPAAEESTEPLTVGTSLFELYLVLQRFVILGSGLCPLEVDTFHIRNFYSWFYSGVAQWLDIAVFKALTRIEKAVELDTLNPVDATLKYSSSAVDTLTIFYQIKVFWEQLNWPDVEGSYTFIAKIIDDICKCSVYYADKMSARVEGMGDIRNVYEQKFEVTSEWCLAINNIDYVRKSLQPFTEELGKDAVTQKLSDLRSPLEAERCRRTLDTVIDNAIDTVKNKIIELLETVVDKMCPSMKRLLVEGAELYNQDNNSIDRVLRYLDNNLATLHEELNEENFNKTLDIIWAQLATILEELIQSNLEKRRPPSFFANLHETLKIMIKSFKCSEDSSCIELARIQKLLQLNGFETSDLIHQIHLDLYNEQEELVESQYGELTVRIKFHNSDMHVEMINARNLIAMDSNGLCDSFVRVHLLPEEKFIGISKPKTQTHYKNKFPLYDEKFQIVISSEQQNLSDGLVMFSVKDSNLMGYNNQYIGEAFVPFKNIPKTTDDFDTLPQIRLQLIRPANLNTEAIKAIEYRLGDKQAKEFMKKFKQRMGNANGAN